MRFVYHYLFAVLWIAFLAYWQIKSIDVKQAQRREPAASGLLRLLLMVTAILLFCYRPSAAWLNMRLWPSNALTFWIGAALTFAGLVFCVWARLHLGRNWSRSVTIKQDHELILTGPYAMVRHPIYTGLLVALLGTALAVGELRAVVAFLLFAISLWIKLRLEEKWMREIFGATYEAYSGRVAALVPFVL